MEVVSKVARESAAGDGVADTSDPVLEAPETAPGWWARHWPKLVAATFWAILVGGYLWFARTYGVGPREAMQQLVAVMQDSVYGPLLYILIYALRPLFFFPGTLLTIAGGFLFGPVLGILLTVVAANSSALVAYTVGRYFGQGILDDAATDGVVHRYAARMRNNSFETVLIMRFIFLPYDLVNYLAGLLRIDWKGFLLATALGSIPGTFSFVLFGASIESFEGGIPALNPWVLALSAGIFVLSLVLSRFFKRRERLE
ncbi:MAG: TVP38/TMEM64 family protein [Litorilinea sp.]